MTIKVLRANIKIGRNFIAGGIKDGCFLDKNTPFSAYKMRKLKTAFMGQKTHNIRKLKSHDILKILVYIEINICAIN